MTELTAPGSRDVGFVGRSHASTITGDEGKLLRNRIFQIGAGILLLFAIVWILASSTAKPFDITRGDNLITHVGYKEAIKAARDTNLPVVTVVHGVRAPVSYEEAYSYEKQTDRVRVVVPVYAGYHFEKHWWRWHLSVPARPLPAGRDHVI